MRILLTGGAGFIGSHLCDFLIKEGHNLVCMDNLVTGKKENIQHLLDNPNFEFIEHDVSNFIAVKGKIDYVLHFASPASPIDYLKYPIKTLKVGSLGTHNALGVAKEYKAKFMLASTSISGNTPILIRKQGKISLVTINSLLPEMLDKIQIEVLSIDNNFNVTFKPISHIVQHLVSGLYSLKYTGGGITLTGDHTVYVFRDGKIRLVNANELSKGDFLVTFSGVINLDAKIPRLPELLIESGYPGDRWQEYKTAKMLFKNGLKYKEIANRLNLPYQTVYEWIITNRRVRSKGVFPELLTKDMVRFFGYYLAEGCTEIDPKRRKYRITLTFGSHELSKAKDAIRIFKKLKLNGSIVDNKEKHAIKVVICSIKLAYLIRHFFGRNAHTKKIPYFIWRLPNEYIFELLRGYTCDARITDNGQIIFSTVSKELALQLTWLLKLNGINGRYSRRIIKEHRSPQGSIIKAGIVYDISVSKIENPFEESSSNIKFARSTYANCIPTTLLRRILQQAKVRKRDRDSRYYSRCYKDTMSKSGCGEALGWILKKGRTACNKEDLKYLRKLISSSLGVAKIMQVKRVKRKTMVYDISVPGSECFFGGGSAILLHNSEVYGDPLVNPQPETYWGNVNPIGPRGVYDESKRFAEAITLAYHNTHKIDTKIARIFNTFGPRMRGHDGRAIPNFIDQALKGEPLTVYGDGSQTRSFCYITDLIDGIYKLMGSGLNQPVNLGNPNEMTVLELGEKIVEITGSKSKIEYKPLPVNDPKVRRPDITLAKAKLNWQPKVSLEEGLKRTVEWFKSD